MHEPVPMTPGGAQKLRDEGHNDRIIASAQIAFRHVER